MNRRRQSNSSGVDTRRASASGLLATVSVTLMLLVCITGCGSSAGESHDASSSKGEVLKAYEAYWVALLGALDPADPVSPALAKHAVDPELAKARAIISHHRDAGEVVRGSYVHQADVSASTADSATVTDCLMLKTRIFDAKTGEKKAKQSPGPFAVEVKLVHGEDGWKVSSIEAGAKDCPSAPQPPRGSEAGN